MDFNDEHFQGPSEGLHKQDMTTFYRSVCVTFGIYWCLLIKTFLFLMHRKLLSLRSPEMNEYLTFLKSKSIFISKTMR